MKKWLHDGQKLKKRSNLPRSPLLCISASIIIMDDITGSLKTKQGKQKLTLVRISVIGCIWIFCLLLIVYSCYDIIELPPSECWFRFFRTHVLTHSLMSNESSFVRVISYTNRLSEPRNHFIFTRRHFPEIMICNLFFLLLICDSLRCFQVCSPEGGKGPSVALGWGALWKKVEFFAHFFWRK